MSIPFLTHEALSEPHAEPSKQQPAAPPPTPKQRGRWLKFVLRMGCTILLFGFLFRSISWNTVLANLEHLDTSIIYSSVIIGFFGVVISAYQWQSLLDAEKIHFDLRKLVNLYLIGNAFNHFLPTGMGGDIVKAYYVGKESNNNAGSASAVVMARLTGFVGMLCVSVSTLLIWHTLFSQEMTLMFVLAALSLCVALALTYIAVVLLPRFMKIQWLENRFVASSLKVGHAIRQSLLLPRSILTAIAFGVIFHLSAALNYYSYASALHMQVPFTFYLVAIPLVSLIAFIPVSINGYGLRETAFVYIFTTMHVPVTTSLVLALLMDAQGILFGTLGGGIYLLWSSRKTLTPSPALKLSR